MNNILLNLSFAILFSFFNFTGSDMNIDWDDSPYIVFQNQNYLQTYDSYTQAVSYAKKYANSSVYFRGNLRESVWTNKISLSDISPMINAPLIAQLPELPRGCEVTSLAMMLKYAGVNVDKMKLAQEVKKVPFKSNGYYGNPFEGFVGNMYTFNHPGLGVYHGPVKALAEKYLPNQIIDLTGSDFTDILYPVSQGKPVWVIINTNYAKLGPQYFETWRTKQGDIKITYKEHSVLITGYDHSYIYFNDPLLKMKNRKAPRKNFEEAWIQMGRQAITYTKQ